MRQRGFTLIELLIAIALMAVLAALGWRGLDVLIRSRDVNQARITRIAVVQTALAQWRADLDATTEVRGMSNIGSVQWNGQVLRLLRRSLPVGDAQSDGGLQVIGWTLRDGRWLRWQSPALTRRGDLLRAWQEAEQWAQNPSDDAQQQQTALLPLTGWQITYFRGDAWVNPLSSEGAAANNPAGGMPQSNGTSQTNTLPDAIRLQLDLDTPSGLPGRLTLDWVRPNFSNTKS